MRYLSADEARLLTMWPKISPGAIIDIVAPSGRFENEVLDAVSRFLQQQGYIARIPADLLGSHDFLAASDEQRLKHLQCALSAPDSEVIWCVRGGHGTTRLMSALLTLVKPAKPKLLVGFSDITTLHLWLNQVWQWPSLHGPMARQVALGLSDPRDVSALLSLWQSGVADYRLTGLRPLNNAAENSPSLTGTTAGTCLSLLQTSIGTPWQLQAQEKILFIEDINEAAYRLDRLLVHLANANVWQGARAIILGDFGENISALAQIQIDCVLAEFAKSQRIPVFALKGFGHSFRNQPIPLGVAAKIESDAGLISLIF